MATAILDMPAPETPDMPKSSTSTRPPAVVLRDVDRVVLTGFMGSGKSTIGPLLADRLGWRFLDLDSEISVAMAVPLRAFLLKAESRTSANWRALPSPLCSDAGA